VDGLLQNAVVNENGILTVTPTKLAVLDDVPHPFPYQGSKRALAHAVLHCLPADTDSLIEPFAGSAAISIAARHAGLVDRTIINDVNAPLMSLWEAILGDQQRLSDEYTSMWNDARADPREYFLNVRSEFNRSPSPAALLYLLNRIVKGAVRYSRSGEFNQSADHRRLGAKPGTVQQRIHGSSVTMAGTAVHRESFDSLLVEAGTGDVVYMDPPYQGVTNVADHRYMAGLTRDSFERALHKANDNSVSYIISYDVVREDNKYGERLDEALGLTHLHLVAGRSAQATLGGGDDVTIESLYLSPALVQRLEVAPSRLASCTVADRDIECTGGTQGVLFG